MKISGHNRKSLRLNRTAKSSSISWGLHASILNSELLVHPIYSVMNFLLKISLLQMHDYAMVYQSKTKTDVGAHVQANRSRSRV